MNQFTLIFLDQTNNQQTQVGQFFIVSEFVQFKSKKNNLGQDSIIGVNWIPVQNTSFTVQFHWIPSLNKMDVPFSHFTFAPQQTLLNAISAKIPTLVITGNLSGEVRVTPTPIDQNDIDVVFNNNLSSTEKITFIKYSSTLEKYFIVTSQVFCYSIYTDILLELISFSLPNISTDIQNIQGFYVSETHNLVIAQIQNELIIRDFSSQSKLPIFYTVSTTSELKYINGFYFDENTLELFIFGDNIIKTSLKLDKTVMVSVIDPIISNFEDCQFVSEIISCRASQKYLVVYYRSTLSQITAFQTTEVNFKTILDTIYKYIIIYNTSIQVYSYTGTLILQLNTFTLNLISIAYYDYFFVVQTTPVAFIFNRQTFKQIGSFTAPGGILRGMIYLPDLKQIGFFSEDLRSGQIIFLNTDNFQPAGFTVNTYDQVGIGKVIKVIYDMDSQMLNYFDELGNNQNILSISKAIDNTFSIEEIQQNIQSKPIDYLIDFTTNTLLVHNGMRVWKMNYNLHTRQARRVISRPNSHFISLNSNDQIYEDRVFLIADYYNTIFLYKNFQITFFSQFSEEIIDMRKLQIQNQSLFIIFYQAKILVFKSYQDMTLESNAQELKLYTFKQLLVKDPERLILNTIDNRIIDYDFFRNQEIFSKQLDILDDIITTLVIGSSRSTNWVLFYGTQTGKIGSYNLLSQAHQSFQFTQKLPIQKIHELNDSTLLCIEANGNVQMTDKSQLNPTLQQSFMDSLKQQIISENNQQLISKKIQILQIDSQNQRFFVNFSGEKKVGIWKLTDFSFIKYLIFPDNEWKYITLSDDLIVLSCSFQFNIYYSSDYSYINYVRRQNRKDRITDLRIIDANKLISIFTSRIEIFLIEKTRRKITLLDSITLSDPLLLFSQVNPDNQQLILIGVSKESIFDKRFALNQINQSYQLGTGISNQQNCQAELTFDNQAQLQNQYEQIQNSNTSNVSYLLQVFFYNELRSLDVIKKDQSLIIMRPINLTNKDLNIRQNSFLQMNFDLNLQGFNLKFVEQNIIINTHNNSKKIVLQDITIDQQDISEQTSIVLQNKEQITLQNINITNVNIQGSSHRILNQNEATLSFISIKTSTNVYIENMVIDNLIFKDSEGCLIMINQVQNLRINYLTIQNSQFDSIFKISQGINVEISNLSIINCKKIRTNYDNLKYSFDLVGINKIILSNIFFQNNTDIFFLSTINNYNQEGKIVQLTDDLLIFDIAQVDNNVYSIPQSNSLHLINLQSSSIQINSLKFQQNNGNIFIYKSEAAIVKKSIFEKNNSIKGGALQVVQLASSLTIIDSKFSKNVVTTSGGGIYLQDVYFFEIDQQSQINSNQALIGGGIRIFNNDTNVSSKYQIKCQMNGNKGEIYGNDVGDLLNDIKIYKVKAKLKENKLVEQTDLLLQYKGSISLLSNQINIQDVQSGGDLHLYIQLLDNEGEPLKVNQNKYLNNLYHTIIKKELDSFFIEFSQDYSKSSILDIKGETLISMRQYDFNLLMFQFSTLSVSSLPLQQNVNALIKIQYQLVDYTKIINASLNFRECKQGEVLVYSQKSQINSNNLVDQIQIVQCQECSFGTYSLINPMVEFTQDALQKLKQNSYFTFQSCKKCPASASYCEGDNIVLELGYWRESRNSDEIIECNAMSPDICNEQAESSQNGCIEGQMGPLCESCDSTGSVWKGKRFTSSISDFKCYECSNQFYQILFITLSAIGLFLYLFLSTIFFVDRYIYHSKCYYVRLMNILPFSKSCTLDQSSYFVKILINYLQISTLLYTQDMNITPQYMNIVPNTTGKPGSQIIISSTCLYGISDLESIGLERLRAYSMSIFPITMVVILFVVLATFRLFQIWKVTYYHKYTMLIVAFLFFQPDSIGFFTKALSCRQIGSKSYQSINNLILCSDDSYNQFSYYFILPNLVFWSLTPAFLFYFLKGHRGKNGEKLNNCTTKFMFGYFYLEYKKEYFYWEFIRIYFKIVIVLVIILLNKVIIQIISILIVMIFIYILCIMRIKPFESEVLNQLEIVSFIVMIPCVVFFQLYQLLQIVTFQLFTAIIHYCFLAYIILLIIKIKLSNQNNPVNRLLTQFFQVVCPISLFNLIKSNHFNNNRALLRWRFLYKNLKKAKDLQNQQQSQKKSFIVSVFKNKEIESFQSAFDLVEKKKRINENSDSPPRKITSYVNGLDSIFPSANLMIEDNNYEQQIEFKPQKLTLLSHFSKNFSENTPVLKNDNELQSTHTKLQDSVTNKKYSKETSDEDQIIRPIALSNEFTDFEFNSKVFTPYYEHQSCNKVYDFNRIFTKVSSPSTIKALNDKQQQFKNQFNN